MVSIKQYKPKKNNINKLETYLKTKNGCKCIENKSTNGKGK